MKQTFRRGLLGVLLVASGLAGSGVGGQTAQAQVLPPLVAGQPAVAKDRLDIGTTTACAVLGSGQIACAGGYTLPDDGFSPTPRLFTSPAIDAVGVQVGNNQGCVRKGSGIANCWGTPAGLGIGVTSGNARNNVNVPPAIGLTDVIDVGSGVDYSCAALASGQARCWGSQSYGLLGNGASSGTLVGQPAIVLDRGTGTALTGVRQIDGAGDFACALISDGNVKCWGSNYDGKFNPPYGTSRADLVRGTISSAEAVAGISNASSISVGGRSACVVIADGTVRCFGNNNTASFPSIGATSTPLAVAGISTARMVAVGQSHACALLADATMTCWGQGTSGQLGRGWVCPGFG
jgi:alpha-tubulin suppressor-like RCC1 family protein